MSSHREAPEIAKDPVADGTDVYAFMHPTEEGQVVLIANFIPLQQPNGGPNFYEFADDVLYDIRISNTNKCVADITYRFHFHTEIRNPNTFLYNTFQIQHIDDEAWNRPQYYSVDRIEDGKTVRIGQNLPVPPVNVGPRSTPNYEDLAAEAVKTIGGRKFFCGQRSDAFFVDLGSIFDLGALRPLNGAHLIGMPAMNGVNAVQSYNCHTIAIQVPATDLTKNHKPVSTLKERRNVIGVWATASRRKARVFDIESGTYRGNGPAVQVSRLGNPLFNEVVVPMAKKDKWNAAAPKDDADYASYVNKPELAGLLPVLYPGAFDNLEAYNATNTPRADLNAVLLTGVPNNIVKNGGGATIFQNYTGPVEADMLRLNMAIAPVSASDPGFSEYGVVGGDVGGWPNGRRLEDDVVAIALKAVAGGTIPLVDPTYMPDGAVAALDDGSAYAGPPILTTFPFMPHPMGGYETVPGTSTVNAP